MQKYTRILAVLLILTILLTNFTACVNKPGYSTPQQDVLTQKVIEKDKIPVTVLVKYAFSINAFEVAVENKFPNLDLVQVGNFTSDMGLDEYEARMKNDDLTDIVMTWPLDCGSQYLEERLLDLSAMPFTSNYNISKLNEISRDGKLYYLPGPSQIRGIVYNKTLFAEKGWEVPTDFDGFISLCKQIEATGIRSLQLGLGDPEVLDTAFIGYSFANCYATPKDTQWIMDYNNGVGSLGDHFAPAFEVFQTLIDNGILKPEDLNINYAQRERMLFDRKCAMIEDSVLLARMGNEIAGNDDEFALMPFFSPVSDGDWARLYPVCYIGLNQHLSEPQNKAKYDLVMQIMEYISTPEGQRALASDTGAMYSSLNGMPPPNDVPEIKALLPALEHGRCAIFPTFKNAQGALREGLAGILTGKLTAENVIQMVDAVNLDPPAAPPPTVIGNASDNFTIMDMGNFLTDAMRTESGCEIALFLDNGKDGLYNGKGLCSTLYKGDISTVDISRLMPDIKRGEKVKLQKITMTGEDLIRTLEYSIPVDNNQFGWFYYFSGLRMEFAPAAEAGTRIHSITDDKGNPIDPKRIYSVAIMDTIVPEKFILSCEETDVFISDLLTDNIQANYPISPPKDNRFIICQP